MLLKLGRRDRGRERRENEREGDKQRGRKKDRKIKVFKSDTLFPYTSSLKYMNVCYIRKQSGGS